MIRLEAGTFLTDEDQAKGMDAKALQKLVEQLNLENVHLREENERLKEENVRLKEENERLREKVDKLERANKRTTTPFRRRSSQKKKKDDEKKAPGRKPGHQGSYKAPPAEEDVDQTIRVPLNRCPECDDQLDRCEDVEQFIIELPETTPQITRLVTQRAVCDSCGRVGSTHPLQTSEATGAAAVQFGPRAKAVAVDLHKKRGLSLNKTTELFDELFGIEMSPGAIVHTEHKLAQKAALDYLTILDELRQAKSVYADETSWWISWSGGQRWLWSFSSDEWSAFRIDPSRGRDVVEQVLGDSFNGVLVSDCLSAYDEIDCEKHKCYAHHLRALSDFNDQYADSELIPKLKAKLREAMALDERFDELEGDKARAELDDLRFEMAGLLLDEKQNPVDEKAAARLRKRFRELFTFVGRPEVDATNNQAERELRPAVITRKISGGNKTERGARSWQILKSIECTLDRQERDFIPYLEQTLCLSMPPPTIQPS